MIISVDEGEMPSLHKKGPRSLAIVGLFLHLRRGVIAP